MDSCFLSKGKSIFSSLSGIIMLWASKLPSPMQIPKQPRCHLQPIGLKTLIYSQAHPLHQDPSHPSLIITPHMISSSLPPSSPSSESSLFRSSTANSSSWSSAIDDFLGTESGVYMNSDYEQEVMGLVSDKSETVNNNHYLIAKRRSQCCSSTNTIIKEYPPPLPHMPRVLTRHYENGNLVLRYEGMQRYLDITRENGRLILNLVQLEDNNEEMLEVEATEPIKETEADDDEVEYEATHYYEGSITILTAASQQMPAKWCLEDDDDEVEYEATHYYEGSITILSAASQQMPAKWCMGEDDDEEERSCGELRKCLTYMGRRSTECVRFGHLQPGSAPLSITAHRVTPVM